MENEKHLDPVPADEPLPELAEPEPTGGPEQAAEVPAPEKTVEAWAAELGADPFDFAGARHLEEWAIGKLTTKAAFEAAIKRFQGLALEA